MEVERQEEKEMLRLLDNDASKAMEKIIDRYGNAVKTICRSILLEYSNEDIEETVSDAFVALWMARHKIEVTNECGIKEYLYGITRRTALNRRRKLTKTRLGLTNEEISDIDASGRLVAGNDVEKEVISKSEYILLHQLIEEMKSPDNEIFSFRYFEGYSIKEIAERMGLKAKTVENRLCRGRVRLRNQLIHCGVEMGG